MFLFRLILLVSLLSACSLGGDIPQDHYYRLPEISLEKLAAPRFDTLLVKPVRASGLYHERAMLYTDKQRPLELHRYNYNFWAEPPASLLQNALYQGMLSSGIAGQVIRQLPRQASHKTDTSILDSRIIHFERQIDGSEVIIQLALEITLHRADDSTLLLSKTYRASEKLQTTAIYPSVEAFGGALERILEKMIEDLQSR